MARKKTRVVPVPLETELPGIAKQCAEAQAKLKKIESVAEVKIAAIREKASRDTWAVITGKLKKHLPEFVRTKEEPNKDAMIEARGDAEVMTKLSMFGVQVEQEDSVFIDVAEEVLR